MKHPLSFITALLTVLSASAQFAPPAGQPGTTAIAADSSIFTAWATGCTVQRGPMNIDDPDLGPATIGNDTMGIGTVGNGVVSLGDGGMAILTFAQPITNGPGWDFAVFENSFSDSYLELAFVEVSSNGTDYTRFPATSNTPFDLQVGSFDTLDATLLDNLAGKYRGGFGTPFDLEQLVGTPALDLDHITHVQLVDVVGCIQDQYATHDHLGQKVNDPWSTAFASSGFDLDAVGVIHQRGVGMADRSTNTTTLFPNPAAAHTRLIFSDAVPGGRTIRIIDAQGRTARRWNTGDQPTFDLDLSGLGAGMYLVEVLTPDRRTTHNLIIADAQ